MQTKKLSLIDGVMLVCGSMIGSGIFIVSADIARNTGGAGWLLLSWLLAGLMTILAAISYGELSSMMPKAGGQYVFLKEAYNPLTGFLYGWTLFTVIQTGTIAAVGVAFAKFTGVLVPAVGEKNILLTIGNFHISAAQVLAIFIIVLLTWFNSRGIQQGSILQRIFTFAKLAALFGLIILGLASFNSGIWEANIAGFWDNNAWQKTSDGIWQSAKPAGLAMIAAMGVSMVGTLFSSDAWNNVTFVSAEMDKPERNVPLSMVIGTAIVTLIYICANLIYLGNIPLLGNPDGSTVLENGIQFAANDRVGTAAAFQIMGSVSLVVMAVLIMVSTFGCNNGLILTGARVYQVMAKDGLFFKQAGELNKNNVPGTALWIQCIWASLLCLSGTYGDLLDYVVFAVLLFYILTVASVFLLRIRQPDLPRPYKAFGYPVLPMLYIILAVTVCVILLIEKPAFTWPGLGIVLAGIPIYFLIRKK